MLNDTTIATTSDGTAVELVHIYVLLHPNKRVKQGYVGQTKEKPSRRLGRHKRKADDGHQRPIYQWSRKVGEPTMKVIKSVPADQANAAEAEVAEQYRAIGYDLLNATGLNKGTGQKRYRATPGELRALLRYEPDTGHLYWRECDRSIFPSDHAYKLHQHKIGKRADSHHSGNPYMYVLVFRTLLRAHRVAFMIVEGREIRAGHILDHDNQVKTDNRWSNLREVTRSENDLNRSMPRNNTSGYIGVYEIPKGSGRFGYVLTVEGQRKWFSGDLRSADAAAAARAAKAKELGITFSPRHGAPKPTPVPNINHAAERIGCSPDRVRAALRRKGYDADAYRVMSVAEVVKVVRG